MRFFSYVLQRFFFYLGFVKACGDGWVMVVMGFGFDGDGGIDDGCVFDGDG